jgi:hypothetical protein
MHTMNIALLESMRAFVRENRGSSLADNALLMLPMPSG